MNDAETLRGHLGQRGGCRLRSAYNRIKPDVVLMAITSQLRAIPALGEVWVASWQAAGLLKPSAIKPVFATLEYALVIRQLGTLAVGDKASLRSAVADIIG